MPKESDDELLAAMNDLKMLMILHLIMSGAKQSQIAQMLGVSEATMSRMIPKEVKRSRKEPNIG